MLLISVCIRTSKHCIYVEFLNGQCVDCWLINVLLLTPKETLNATQGY